MSLMSKLSAILLISASLFGATDAEVISFLKKGIGKNPSIVSLEISIVNKTALEESKGVVAYVLSLKGTAKENGRERPIAQLMTYFVIGDLITPELRSIKTGERLNDTLTPDFKSEYYTDENLLYGNKDSKHKVAIFSDPLCPFCRNFVPDAINYMKERPEDFAVYYFHFPLPSLHPAAVALTKAAIAAEQKGKEGVVLLMYKSVVDAKEESEQKIVDAFNKASGTDITVADIHAPAVEEQFERDQQTAMKMMVSGTPTLFFDGKKDASKTLFKQVK